MSALTFQRLCVFILVLTGILLIASSVLKYFATQFFADTALIGQTFGLAWAVLLVFGLLAIYHFDIEQAGMIGFAAFVVAMIGTVLSVIPEYLLLSSLAGSSNATLELEIVSPIQIIASFIFLLGYLGFGLVLLYAGSLSKMGALAFSLGMAIGVTPALIHNAPIYLSFFGALLGGVGSIWLGFSLLTKNYQKG
jgi:hypothetical protein